MIADKRMIAAPRHHSSDDQGSETHTREERDLMTLELMVPGTPLVEGE